MRARDIYICTVCSEEKEETEFHQRYNRRAGQGRVSICKVCTKERQKEYDYNRNQEVRLQVLEHYSNGLMKCNCCGESQIRFLCIDHIANDGAEHRKEIGKISIARYLIRNSFPKGYQVLCYNCNCGKAHNKGVCPHKEM